MDINKMMREERAALKEDEIYTSAALVSQLESTAYILTGHKIDVEIMRKKGYTGGSYTVFEKNKIVLDSLCEIVTTCTTQEERFRAFIGLFYHELAHNLYTFADNDINEIEESILKSVWTGTKVNANTPKNKADTVAQIEVALSKEPLRKIINRVYHEIENRIIDQRDENSIIQDHPSLAKWPVLKAREMLVSSFSAYEEMGKLPALLRIYNEILVYCRIGHYFVLDQETISQSPELTALGAATGYIDRATEAKSDRSTLATAVTEAIENIWPYIQNELEAIASRMMGDGSEQNDEESSGSSDGGGTPSGKDNSSRQGAPDRGKQTDAGKESSSAGKSSSTSPLDELSPEQIQELANKVADMLDTAGPEKKIGSKTKKKQRPNTDTEDSSDQAQEPGDEAAEALLSAVMKELAKGKAEEKAEQVLSSTLSARIQQIDANDAHKGVKVDVRRLLAADHNAVSEYNKIMRDVKRYSDRLKKEVEDAFKELKDGGLVRHRHFGRRLCPEDAYRPDGAYFAKKAIPQDIPEMAVSILVDCSGSMHGERINAAVRAAVLLHDFATKLGIPVFVAGHCVQKNDAIEYTVVSDFETATDKDKYRIPMLRPGGCNRDGLALKVSASLLMDRPEDIKLLFIISDGQPNASGYGGAAAAKDIRSVITTARSNGVEIFAAAIGSDKDLIASIYGESFIDISDLSKLPKIFTKIVKQRIFDSII